MRLLRRNSVGQFSLTEDLDGDGIPEYAILSHTWGADKDEVTFEDITNGTGENKPGYKKIRFCGEKAKEDDLLHFWVDTCCINKSNKAELSRSINSMFRWYRNATQCYVYLSDVSIKKRKRNESSKGTWELDFQKSRWFTRGWTLQELLAPAAVKFFSREGKRLGDKSSLMQAIYEITNIPHSALQGDLLSQFTFQERLRWIQHRETKLEEDKAYSLLGIFDVYILPIYGEGAASSLARLEHEFDQVQKCIRELHLTDPRKDKNRIENDKGGLLKDSYRWILDNSDFQQWRNNQQSQLLWIRGDPGKGKTMLLCGIINELKTSIAKSDLLLYFFYQATDSRINNATAMLRGLIYMLVGQQPSLVSHIRKKYDQEGRTLFEDANTWVALSGIFTNILQDPSLHRTYLIIDALDECVTDLPKLLDFIVQASSLSPRVKWIVSSRNWPIIGKDLSTAMQNVRLCLELNEKSVSAAVKTFIQFKVDWLARRNRYSNDAQDAVQQYLSLNSNGTFLWVALVCQELADISGWEAEGMLNEFPPGLDAIYRRMIDQVCNSKNSRLCKNILAVVSVVYRPITLDELVALVDMPNKVDRNYEALSEIIGLCGSFLTLRERTISFVHQSAKDFLIEKASREIFHSRTEDEHYNLFQRSLLVMSRTLRRDIYSLHTPGFSIDQVKQPDPDPLAIARYSSLYWVDHLFDCDIRGNTSDALKDGGSVDSFLQCSYLYWLEALTLVRSLSSGIVMIRKLENRLQSNEAPNLFALIHDARRFILHNRGVIEHAPLQLYCSALVFAPEKSIIRGIFEKDVPAWIQTKPKVQAYWSAALQTLEGHTSEVNSVAFSRDGKLVVSGSHDQTVRLWDTATGAALLQPLEGHTSWVSSVAFSPDGKLVVSGSHDQTVRLWDTATGAALLQPLEGHTDAVSSVAFSPDGKLVVSGSWDQTVRLWDTATGAALLQPLEGHTSWVSSVAVSPDGRAANHPLLISDNWIVEEGAKILWLHPDYRSPSCSATWNKKLVLGYGTGRLFLFGFHDGVKGLYTD